MRGSHAAPDTHRISTEVARERTLFIQLNQGMIRSQVGNLARTPGNSLLFAISAMGSINDHSDPGSRFNYWSTNATSSSNSVFPEDLPSKYQPSPHLFTFSHSTGAGSISEVHYYTAEILSI